MENIENNTDMKKPVEIWQLVVAVIAVIISVVSASNMYASGIKEEAARQATVTENIKLRVSSIEKYIEKDEERKEETSRDIRSILMMLKDKQDRK